MADPTARPPKLTRNQGLVHARLAAAGRAMSAYELLDALRQDGLRAPVQVYRALDKLTGIGLIHRLESCNAYIACAGDHHRAHAGAAAAFAICDDCGQVTEFLAGDSMAALAGWARASGFATRQTTIELRGRCAGCGTA
ncbi:MAG: Fur family transcriptional regulator [Sneathiellaceae bacterium]